MQNAFVAAHMVIETASVLPHILLALLLGHTARMHRQLSTNAAVAVPAEKLDPVTRRQLVAGHWRSLQTSHLQQSRPHSCNNYISPRQVWTHFLCSSASLAPLNSATSHVYRSGGN